MRDFRQPNFNSQRGEEIKQVFRSAVLEDEAFDEDGINVELAAPWRRVAAAALNLLIMVVFTIGIGFIAGLVGGLLGSNFGNPALIGYGTMLVYVVGQAMLMANSGQSLGKRMMGIRAIHHELQGRYAGDWVRAEHDMMDALAETIWSAQRNGQGLDVNLYMTRLRRLVGLGQEDEARLNPHEVAKMEMGQ